MPSCPLPCHAPPPALERRSYQTRWAQSAAEHSVLAHMRTARVFFATIVLFIGVAAYLGGMADDFAEQTSNSHVESSCESLYDFSFGGSIAPPEHPRHSGRKVAFVQPEPVERIGRAGADRWRAEAVVSQQGTGKAASKVYDKRQIFFAASRDEVTKMRAVWIRDYTAVCIHAPKLHQSASRTPAFPQETVGSAEAQRPRICQNQNSWQGRATARPVQGLGAGTHLSASHCLLVRQTLSILRRSTCPQRRRATGSSSSLKRRPAFNQYLHLHFLPYWTLL